MAAKSRCNIRHRVRVPRSRPASLGQLRGDRAEVLADRTVFGHLRRVAVRRESERRVQHVLRNALEVAAGHRVDL